MAALTKGKARAVVDQEDIAQDLGQHSTQPAGNSQHGMQSKTSRPKSESQPGSRNPARQPAASSSSSSKQDFSPQPSGSGSEEDASELELEHESEDEFEQHRSGAAPGYAQYMGDSDLDEQEDDSEDEDGLQHGQSDSEADSAQDGSDGQNDYIDEVQADLQQIPLETLIKAQKKLKKLSKPAGSKAVVQEGSTETGTSSSTRRGRTESRRGVVANIPSVSQKEARSKPARPKARDSKHAPTEMTSKRAVGRFRQVVEVEKDKRRDPRFDALSGELDDTRFRTSYSFIDEARKEEIKRIKFALYAARKRKGAVDMEELNAMSTELQKLQSKQAEAERQQRQASVMSEWKHQEKEKRQSGKSEFYLKRGEKKKMVETKRMEEVSQDKRRLRKVLKRKDQAEKKKSIKTAPPRRQT